MLHIEWGTLHFMERVPTYVLIGLMVDSALILGVLESRQWLQCKGRYYFWGLLAPLLVAYLVFSVCPYIFPF
jgi:hypothetical protein